MGFSRQEYWSGLPWPPPGDLPNPGIEPKSHSSLELADRFFNTSNTWEVQISSYRYLYLSIYLLSTYVLYICVGFLNVSVVKNSLANAGDVGSVPGLGRSPGEGNGNPLQYSCLGNPQNRGVWWVTVHGVSKESDTTEGVHAYAHAHTCLYCIMF